MHSTMIAMSQPGGQGSQMNQVLSSHPPSLRNTLYETFMEDSNMFQHVPEESSSIYKAMGFDRCMNDQECRLLLELYERGYNKLFDDLGRMMHGYLEWERLEQYDRFDVYIDAIEPVFTRLQTMWEAEPNTDDRLRFLRYTLGHRMNEGEETFLDQLILTPTVASFSTI